METKKYFFFSMIRSSIFHGFGFAQHSNSSSSLCLPVCLYLTLCCHLFPCRYSPLTPPTTNWFPVKGVTIADGSPHCNQFICNVELEKLSAHSSGQYRCEVSGDAPEFKLIDQTANMTVGGRCTNDPLPPKAIQSPWLDTVVRNSKRAQ